MCLCFNSEESAFVANHSNSSNCGPGEHTEPYRLHNMQYIEKKKAKRIPWLYNACSNDVLFFMYYNVLTLKCDLIRLVYGFQPTDVAID